MKMLLLSGRGRHGRLLLLLQVLLCRQPMLEVARSFRLGCARRLERVRHVVVARHVLLEIL